MIGLNKEYIRKELSVYRGQTLDDDNYMDAAVLALIILPPLGILLLLGPMISICIWGVKWR